MEYRRFISNFASGDRVHCAAQLLQSEVTITRGHACHRRRTPPDDLRNLRNRHASIQHPRYRSVTQIVKTAREGLDLLLLLAPLRRRCLVRNSCEGFRCADLGRFPRFYNVANCSSWVRLVCLQLKFVSGSPVTLFRKDIVLRLALREQAGPKSQGCQRTRVEGNDAPSSRWRLVFSELDAAGSATVRFASRICLYVRESYI